MQILVTDFISLDGVVQAPGGPDEDRDGGFAHGGWSMPYFDVETMGPAIDAALERSDGLLYGRRTWEVMAAAWPERSGDPFADRINVLPKYVASRTLADEDMRWNTTLLPADDAIGAIRELRERAGGALQVWGSSTLATQLFEHDLVDELLLFLEPVLLGGGKGVFPADGAARPLELVGCEQAATGVLVLEYRRRG
ncbi:MAG TPA: dihydrofolate reductase family protein [Gaiellaceae bacterium]|nr:dihydrofolate reductase family protein [Gaiellaceae bacterium]